MITATLALAGFFVALYLSLWKLGVVGNLACGTGGCEYVQTSSYAVLLGVPVAFYGVAGYLALLAVSLAESLARRFPAESAQWRCDRETRRV